MPTLPDQTAGGNGTLGRVSGQPGRQRAAARPQRMKGTAQLGHGVPSMQRVQALLTAALSGEGGTTAGTATLTVRSARRLGSLWAGYGSITECETDDEEAQSLIVKEVHPPALKGLSHERKLRSYQVEAAFYQQVAPRLPASAACHVPRCLGVHSTLHRSIDGVSISSGSTPDGDSGCGTLQLVMVDLRREFPRSCTTLDEAHTKAALSWLAAFHAACWGADAAALGLWEHGSYWCLQTRLAELEAMGPEWQALQAAAHELDARLAATPWRTLCHGDFKAQNLLFSEDRGASSLSLENGLHGSPAGRSGGQSVPQLVRAAGFDFQYVGGGSGLRDVAKLFCNSVEPQLLEGGGEEALLRYYHHQLLQGLQALAASTANGTGSSTVAAAASGSCAGSASGSGPVGCPAKAAQALEQYSFQQLQGDFRLALADYVRFCAGWPRGLWGNTEWAIARAQACLEELGLA